MPFLLPLINLLRRLGWKDYAIGGLVAGAVSLVLLFYHQHMALEQARLVYLHPQTRTIVRTVTVTGPVQTKTIVVERPGEKVTTIVEDRGPVTQVAGSDVQSAPVPLSVTLAPRSDRWLVAVQVSDLRFHELRAYTPLVGYSIRNRVDLLAGFGAEGGKLQVGWRF